MQRETLQICAVVLPGQTSEYQITPLMERDDRKRGMVGVKERRMGGEAEINAAKPQACAEKLRIDQHVNLNPFGERRKHTGRANKGLSGKERDVRSLSSHSLLHPLSDQPVAGSSREIPLCQPLNHSLHLTWLVLLPHPLFLFGVLSSLLHVILPNSSVWTLPSRLDVNPLSLSTPSSFQLSRQ